MFRGKANPVCLLEGVSSKIPTTVKFATSQARLPDGDKPVIISDNGSTKSKNTLFLAVTPGVSRATLEEVTAFTKAQKLVFTNLDNTFGVVRTGVTTRLLSVLGRKPGEVIAFFCMGTVLAARRYLDDHYYSLLMQGGDTHVAFQSKANLVDSGVHCKWIIPVQPA